MRRCERVVENSGILWDSVSNIGWLVDLANVEATATGSQATALQ